MDWRWLDEGGIVRNVLLRQKVSAKIYDGITVLYSVGVWEPHIFGHFCGPDFIIHDIALSPSDRRQGPIREVHGCGVLCEIVWPMSPVPGGKMECKTLALCLL